MKRKVERIANNLAKRLSTLEGVEAITLAELVAEEIADPYFFLSLDVYYRGKIPDPSSREGLFSGSGAFESSNVAAKDRFLIEGLPIRVEYKDIARIESILGKVERNLMVFRQTGTYMLHRLENSEVLFKKSLWIDFMREELKALPASFWSMLASSAQATMEHYLSDLTAAVMHGDRFFYLISAAGFIKSYCSLLFVLNHRFEPSGRVLAERVHELPHLPENFRGRFETFLKEDPEFTPARKREIAELLARGVLPIT